MALLRCPQCRHPLDMADVEVYGRLTTLHGDDAPIATECDGCGGTFYVREHVARTWTVGATAEAAADLLAPDLDGVPA